MEGIKQKIVPMFFMYAQVLSSIDLPGEGHRHLHLGGSSLALGGELLLVRIKEAARAAYPIRTKKCHSFQSVSLARCKACHATPNQESGREPSDSMDCAASSTPMDPLWKLSPPCIQAQ